MQKPYLLSRTGVVYGQRGAFSLPLGRVEHHDGKWWPVDLNGAPLAGPSKVADLSALLVIRHMSDKSATLADLQTWL